MGDKIHVFLLYPGGPNPTLGLRSYLTQQIAATGALRKFPSFLRPLITWFLLRSRLQQLPQLTDSCTSYKASQQQAQELARLLGSEYKLHPVYRYGEQKIDSALSEIPKKALAILLPLIPFRTSTLLSLYEIMREQLHRRNVLISEVGTYGLQNEYACFLAKNIRAAIIDLQTPQSYALLFIIGRQPEGWKTTTKPLQQEAAKCVNSVLMQLNKTIDFAICHGSTKQIQKSLIKLQQNQSLILIPLSWSSKGFEQDIVGEKKLRGLSQQAGFTECIYVHPPECRPDFMSLLVEKIKNAKQELKDLEEAEE